MSGGSGGYGNDNNSFVVPLTMMMICMRIYFAYDWSQKKEFQKRYCFTS